MPVTTRTITAREVASTCLCLHVQRASRKVGRRYDQAFRPLGLTNGQFSILMALSRPQPTAMPELAEILGMDRTTLTAALKPLERRGLLQLGRNTEDRRARQMALTDEGRTLVGEAVPLWEQAQVELGALMPGASLDRLRADLKAIV